MATIPSGQVARIQIPSAQSLTFTPAVGGRMSINGRTQFGEAVTPREIFVATAVSFNAGDVVSAEAVNGDATYTDPSTGSSSTAYTDLTGLPTDNPALASALSAKAATVTTINGYPLSANVTLAKADVGLGNVDNTSDVNKPISTATQTALNAKAPSDNPTFSGTVTGAAYSFSGNGSVGGTLTATNVTVNTTLNVPTPALTDASSKAVNTSFLTSWGLQKQRAYTPPTNEAALTSATAPAQVTCDWINTIVSDGDQAFVNWAGNGQELVITMEDGTEFIRYWNGTQDVLKRSPTGGGGSASTWTTVYTTSNVMGYSVILRDRNITFGSSTLIHICAVGTSWNWSLRIRAVDKAGTVITDYTVPYNGFLQGLSTNPYIRAAIGTDGQFVLMQPDSLWPAQENARFQTRDMTTYLLRGRYTKTSGSTGSFSFDPLVRIPTAERWAYHVPFVGLNGDPDQIAWIAGRDVLCTEDRDPLTNLVGNIGSGQNFYSFDQVCHQAYNFRNKELTPIKYVTGRTGFLNGNNKARVTYTNGTTQMTVHEVTEGTLRINQVITNLSNVTGGITNGTTITSWASGTGGAGSVANLSSTIGATPQAAPGVLLQLADPQPPTPWNRFFQAIKSSDGYIWFTYQKIRHLSSSGAAITSGSSVRIVKMSIWGDVMFDEPILPEGGGKGYGYHTMYENPATGTKYVCRVAAGSQQTEVHFMRVYENPTAGATTTGSTTSGSNVITIPAGATGQFLPGMWITGTNIPAGVQITGWNSYTPSAGGTIFINGNATATTAGTCTFATRGVCGCEPPSSINTINNVWGTNSTYMGVPQTLPARSSGFLAWTCDDRSGSAARGNQASVFISRRINDAPTNTSTSGTERIEHCYVRFPA